MNAREKRSGPRSVSEIDVKSIYPAYPDHFAELSHKSNWELRREWLKKFEEQFSFLERAKQVHLRYIVAIDYNRGVPSSTIRGEEGYFDFFNFCVEDVKHPEVSILGIKLSSLLCLAMTWIQQFDSGEDIPRCKRLMRTMSSYIDDTSLPCQIRTQAVKSTALFALLESESILEGGVDFLFRRFLEIVHVASSKLLPPLLPVEAWLSHMKINDDDNDDISEGNEKLEFLNEVLCSINVLVSQVSFEVLRSKSDELLGDLEALSLNIENAHVVESSVSLMISLYDILKLKGFVSEETVEDTTLISERLVLLSDAEFRKQDERYENRRKWETLKESLEAAAQGRPIEVELKWFKIKRVYKPNRFKNLGLDSQRYKTDTQILPVSLATTITFIKDGIGRDFINLMHEGHENSDWANSNENLVLKKAIIDMIDEFDSWAVKRDESEHFRKKAEHRWQWNYIESAERNYGAGEHKKKGHTVKNALSFGL